MKLFVFSIRDRSSVQFDRPFCGVNNGSAIRGFSDAVNSKEKGNVLNEHPEDFDLYVLGEFDTETGKFETHDPRQIAIGKDMFRG